MNSSSREDSGSGASAAGGGGAGISCTTRFGASRGCAPFHQMQTRSPLEYATTTRPPRLSCARRPRERGTS